MSGREVVPYALLFSRLALAPVCPLMAWRCAGPTAGALFVSSFAWAIVSDIFDGVLARRWGASTAAMRRWDSSVDTVSWISAVGSLLVLHRAWALVLVARSVQAPRRRTSPRATAPARPTARRSAPGPFTARRFRSNRWRVSGRS